MSDDHDQSGFDLGDKPAEPYVVLARKYRPETFADLIGQDAMVQTLRNAFATDRIAQGFMLTGVRGVGKTTTARILARALNYEKDGVVKPTVDFDGYGIHCLDIIRSRHPDVVEMDAASNTGVDNIREIIESARYRPLTGRYKVFIIDEVHMLSKGAFNALLKTLEEPPGHVKFIFATTEVRKVPVTVLSRCQRFDLRRVDVPVLSAHFARITEKEGATADEDALLMIARAAEGSVRDGLSILDQAIAMGAGRVVGEDVRRMIGLADRGRIFDLADVLTAGTPKAALEAFDGLYRDGADPEQVLADLADVLNAVTKAKVAGAAALGEELSAAEKRRAGDLAAKLSVPILSRAWQMLIKGLEEAANAPSAKAAAEMVLIRIAFTADLPTPDQIVRALGGAPVRDASGSGSPRGAGTGSGTTGTTVLVSAPIPGRASGGSVEAGMAPRSADATARRPEMATSTQPSDPIGRLATFEEVVAFVGERRDARLKLELEDRVSCVRCEPGRIEINLLAGARPNLAGDLGEKLSKWTGTRWIVTVTSENGAEPIGAVRRRQEAAEIAEIRSHPAVSALIAALPGAQMSVRSIDLAPTQASHEDDTGADDDGDSDAD